MNVSMNLMLIYVLGCNMMKIVVYILYKLV